MGATGSKNRAYLPIDKLDKIPCNVQWAVAIYPAYVLTDGVNGGNKNGGNEDDVNCSEFSFDRQVAPCFLFTEIRMFIPQWDL